MSVSVSFEASAMEASKRKSLASFGTAMLPNLTTLVMGPTSKLRTLLPGTCGSYGDLLSPVFALAPGTRGRYPLAHLLPDAAGDEAFAAPPEGGAVPYPDDAAAGTLNAASLDATALSSYVDEECARVEREMPRLFKVYGRAPRKVRASRRRRRAPSGRGGHAPQQRARFRIGTATCRGRRRRSRCRGCARRSTRSGGRIGSTS